MARRKNKAQGEAEVTQNTDATEGAVKNPKSIVPTKYKERYGKDGSCGDEMAALLKATVNIGPKGAVDPDALNSVGAANGIDVGERWGSLNIGQQRMNLGNVLRARLKRGEPVTIGTSVLGATAEAANS